MLFHINPALGVPTYLQVINQVKHAVASGVLRPGDRLPPVRKLAADLVINPNTVAKAYQELERLKIVTTVQGGGTFIAEVQERLAEREKVAQLQPHIRQVIVEGFNLGLKPEEILRLFKRELEAMKR